MGHGIHRRQLSSPCLGLSVCTPDYFTSCFGKFPYRGIKVFFLLRFYFDSLLLCCPFCYFLFLPNYLVCLTCAGLSSCSFALQCCYYIRDRCVTKCKACARDQPLDIWLIKNELHFLSSTFTVPPKRLILASQSPIYTHIDTPVGDRCHARLWQSHLGWINP